MDRLQEILARFNGSGTTFEPLSPRDYEQFKVDGLNDAVGNRNEEDGYECKLCKNKAFIAKLIENADGTYSHCFADCKCAEIRRSIMRMKRSGLKNIIKDYTFEKFEDVERWQKTLKAAAMEYAQSPIGWFFLGGQSGCGKSHLCTAICRKFLLEGRSVQYMAWRDDIVRLKQLVNDPEYGHIIDRYKKSDVLYIDDLFKTGNVAQSTAQRPTDADVNIAFEIINFRYNNPDLLTIVSSELSEDELIEIDEATFGRIFERGKSISIAKDRKRNYRLRKAVTV